MEKAQLQNTLGNKLIIIVLFKLLNNEIGIINNSNFKFYF